MCLRTLSLLQMVSSSGFFHRKANHTQMPHPMQDLTGVMVFMLLPFTDPPVLRQLPGDCGSWVGSPVGCRLLLLIENQMLPFVIA